MAPDTQSHDKPTQSFRKPFIEAQKILVHSLVKPRILIAMAIAIIATIGIVAVANLNPFKTAWERNPAPLFAKLCKEEKGTLSQTTYRNTGTSLCSSTTELPLSAFALACKSSDKGSWQDLTVRGAGRSVQVCYTYEQGQTLQEAQGATSFSAVCEVNNGFASRTVTKKSTEEKCGLPASSVNLEQIEVSLREACIHHDEGTFETFTAHLGECVAPAQAVDQN